MKKFALFAIVAMLSLVLTACGGGGGNTVELEVTMGEGGALAFNPNTLTVNKGDTVKVTLVNADPAQPHSFVINELNAKSGQVAAGQTKTYTFTASQAGEFQFYCDVPGHKEGGMVGTITVNE